LRPKTGHRGQWLRPESEPVQGDRARRGRARSPKTVDRRTAAAGERDRAGIAGVGGDAPVITREQVLLGRYPTRPLGEIVEFLDNLRRPVTESDRKPGLFPYFG